MLTLYKSDIDWDYEWDYSMGLLENNGWAKTVSGSAASSMIDSGQKLTSAYGAYVRLAAPSQYLTMNSGIIEVRAVCSYQIGSTDATGGGCQNLRIGLSNGTNGIATVVNGSTRSGATQIGLKLMNASSGNPSAATHVAPWVSGEEHTIRLVLNNGVADVFVDGALKMDNIGSSTIYYTTMTAVWSQSQLNGETILKYVKLKKIA